MIDAIKQLARLANGPLSRGDVQYHIHNATLDEIRQITGSADRWCEGESEASYWVSAFFGALEVSLYYDPREFCEIRDEVVEVVKRTLVTSVSDLLTKEVASA